MNRLKTSTKLSRSLSTSLLCLGLSAAVTGMSLGTAMPAIAQSEPVLRTLTVTGQGRQTTAATLAQVDLGVEIQGRTAEEVQQQVAQRADAVVKLLQSRNVDKLQTTGIRLNPRYDYNNGRSDLVGYVGSNTVSFQVAANQAGPLLDDAVQAGATQIQNISFVATDAAIADAQQAALRAAVADAQRQANTVLSTLNLGPQEIVSIQINGANPPIPMPLPARAQLANAEADVSTPVVSGEQTVEARVTLQIRY